jgi:RNA polymerase sigma factor (sigma-70 family)
MRIEPFTLTDNDLIKCCQQGDPKAQEQLYGRLADRMYRVCLRYIKSQVDAEDVLISAFTKVFKNIKTFSNKGQGSLEGWVRKIVINESLMWLRRRHNFNLTECLDDALPDPDLTQFSALDAEDINKMISELPMGYRTVFNLNVIEGFSHQEVAGMLSITESTSRTQLFKAKAILRKMLTREGYQYGT